MNLDQDRFQSIQDFRDLYLAMMKVCDVLVLRFGRENNAQVIIKEKGG